MRLSDLLHSTVVDTSGQQLGSVDDVRLVQDGPMLANFGAALRLDGLVVGRGSIGLRLGYHRAGVKGPWLLKRIFGAAEAKAHYVPWDDVESWDVDDHLVRLRVDSASLPRLTDV